MPSPRTSFNDNPDGDKLQIVDAPQGLTFLPRAEAAPKVRKYVEPMVTEAPAGNPDFPTRAPESDLRAAMGDEAGLGHEAADAQRS